jgi:hypothetical protein
MFYAISVTENGVANVVAVQRCRHLKSLSLVVESKDLFSEEPVA